MRRALTLWVATTWQTSRELMSQTCEASPMRGYELGWLRRDQRLDHRPEAVGQEGLAHALPNAPDPVF